MRESEPVNWSNSMASSPGVRVESTSLLPSGRGEMLMLALEMVPPTLKMSMPSGEAGTIPSMPATNVVTYPAMHTHACAR